MIFLPNRLRMTSNFEAHLTSVLAARGLGAWTQLAR